MRLVVLLACLLAALAALLGTRTNVFSAAASGEEKPRSWCGYVPPALASVPFDEVAQLRASLLAVIAPLSRARYAWGSAAPEALWNDRAPTPLSAHSQERLWPASYEMRVWTPNPQLQGTFDDVVADVFSFASSRQADRFDERAASARCHAAGIAGAPSRPRRARLLTWVNPDGYTQDDVILASGARVYRVDIVPPRQRNQHVSGAAQQAALTRIESLACELPAAGCGTRPATASAPSN
jgi:hypothetical protein